MKVTPKKSDYEAMQKDIPASLSSADLIVHPANERGFADHGWLQAHHSFSFAQWYDPEKIHFGALRVLNDDTVDADMGFGTHPHDNMEIITIPLEGRVRHKDSMGNEGTIEAGEIQVMSAGQGILHSEYNDNTDAPLKLFQIWIFPRERGVTPRYDQKRIDLNGMKNNFLQLVSPNADDSGLWIHQDAWIHMSSIDEGNTLTYSVKKSGNGVYIMNIEGDIRVANTNLMKRDAIGVQNVNTIEITANKTSKLLVLEVPMNL